MTDIARINEWKDKTGERIYEEEFFLRQVFDGAYQNAIKRAASMGQTFNPIEQLSPKGLALMSAIYAEKDHSEKQPLISSTIDDLRHVLRLIAKSTPGTSLTIIIQFTDAEKNYFTNKFGIGHKTVAKLEKVDNGDVNILCMDSINSELYASTIEILAMRVFSKENQKFNFYHQKDINNPNNPDKPFARQMDEYQCGIFALKDARELNREKDIFADVQNAKENVFNDEDDLYSHYTYELPVKYLKNVQSRTFSNHLLATHGNEIVNTKGSTLKETHDKHNIVDYAQHFSEKYRNAVLDKIHNSDPKLIRAAVEKYDAHYLTAEKLEAIYGPQKIKNALFSQQAQLKQKLMDIKNEGKTIDDHSVFTKFNGKNPAQ